MATKDFYTNYYARECSGNGNSSEIPTVPHTLESPFKDRLISKRGAICSCAAAVACMGSGLGFGTLIPADQTPQIVQLQKELENKNKKIDELIELTFEDDENNSLLNKVVDDNEFRKANQEEQNKEILKLQGEKQALTLQVDKQLEEITKLKKSLEDEAKKFIKKAFKKLCEKGNWVGVGRGYNRKFSTAECKKVADEV